MSDKSDRILRLSAVLARTGLSRSVLYRKVAPPAQVQLAARCVGWRESASTEWLKNPIFSGVWEQASDYSGLGYPR